MGFSLVQWLSCVVVLYLTLDIQPSAQARTLQVRPLVLASVVCAPGMPFWISWSYKVPLSADANLLITFSLTLYLCCAAILLPFCSAQS